jgi:hypothetical protein
MLDMPMRQRAAADIELFGGHFHAPRRIDEVPWRVVQRMCFLVW